ncbi:UNVERIFIED_CONTAM: hypothetical protein PYX00_011498 [Menopon gallinae]|uniref:HIT domain-containing protein n=1 Tax=Menopon gallinae TaxID=328185 RepID=A0AAW2H7S6_9NEOP
MVQDVKTESQLLDILKKQGFNEEIITKAMQGTSSRCLDDIIDYIEEYQKLHKQDPEFEAKEKKLEDDIRKKREESLKNQMYLQKLREQIKADQQEREQMARQKIETDVVKSEAITDFGECTIKVRYDGRFCIMHFKKTNTTADLLKKIEADFGLKSFKLFLVHPPVEVVASERTLEEIAPMKGFTTSPDAGFIFGGHPVSGSHIVFQTELSVLFVNLRPFQPNHLLVSPRFPHKRLEDLSKEECTDLFGSVRLATIVLSRTYSGTTIGIQDGLHAGQSVHHVHVHVVPRSCEQIRVLLDVERKNRSFVEMHEEASYLRSLFADAHRRLLHGVQADSC